MAFGSATLRLNDAGDADDYEEEERRLPRLLSWRRKWRADERTRVSRLGWHFFPGLCRRATCAGMNLLCPPSLTSEVVCWSTDSSICAVSTQTETETLTLKILFDD